LERNFRHKNVYEDLTFAMMIEEVETSFGEGFKGEKHGFLGLF